MESTAPERRSVTSWSGDGFGHQLAALIGCQNGCQNKLAAYRWQFVESDADGMRCANGPCTCCLSDTVFLLGQLDAVSIIDPEIERQRHAT